MINQEIQKSLHWRYATKKYDASKKISEKDFNLLLESLQMAPSSFGIQPWQFHIVESPEIREKLKAVSWNQTQVTEASHYIVLTYKAEINLVDVQNYIDYIAQVRSLSAESMNGFKDMLVQNLCNAPKEKIEIWSQRQAYIAMGFLLETAALMKIDSTPIEGMDPLAYDKILNIEGSGWKTIACVALGYRHDEDAYQKLTKVRYPADKIFKRI